MKRLRGWLTAIWIRTGLWIGGLLMLILIIPLVVFTLFQLLFFLTFTRVGDAVAEYFVDTYAKWDLEIKKLKDD